MVGLHDSNGADDQYGCSAMLQRAKPTRLSGDSIRLSVASTLTSMKLVDFVNRLLEKKVRVA